MSRRTLVLCFLASIIASWSTSAIALDYDEALDGDFSGLPDAPTEVVLDEGSNRLVGMLDGSADARDYVTFTLRPGETLIGITLVRWDDALLPFLDGNIGFHALAEGPTSFIPDFDTAPFFLGGDHLDPLATPEGTDLLPVLAMAPLAGTGFEVPLGPGTYTYLIQQTTPIGIAYEFDLIVAVPEPSTALLMGTGLAGLAACGRAARRRSQASAA